MKITIITPFTFGYIDALAEKLAEKENVTVEFLNISSISFQYASTFQRVKNFFLKTILNRNLKQEYRMMKVKEELGKLPPQDVIFVVRPDLLNKSVLEYARSRTAKMISFYFDAIENVPEKRKLLGCFDEVYSYERKDVEKFGLKFITNFIPLDKVRSDGATSGVFTISTHDDRTFVLEGIAEQLKRKRYPYRFVVKTKKGKPITTSCLEVIYEDLDIWEVKEHIEAAEILLDIQKENQKGLSFRVFEALGYDKKLITSNEDIVTYDFYNPANILVIDKSNPVIPEKFLKMPHEPVPEEIKNRYRRNQWISRVFGVS